MLSLGQLIGLSLEEPKLFTGSLFYREHEKLKQVVGLSKKELLGSLWLFIESSITLLNGPGQAELGKPGPMATTLGPASSVL